MSAASPSQQALRLACRSECVTLRFAAAGGHEKRPLTAYRVPVRWNDARTFAELSAADVTYQEVGATRDDRLPTGYGHVHRDVSLGSGRSVFEEAVDGLFGWQMHRGAGLAVTSTAERAATGVVVVLRAGWSPLRLTIPCRVVYTVEANDRRGFAYGTLPGHPEQGEEAFMIGMTNAGDVRIRIRSFSRPASFLARSGGPLTRMVQEYVTDRYVDAIRGLVRPDTKS